MSHSSTMNLVINLDELTNRLSNDNIFLKRFLKDYVKDLKEKLDQIEMLMLDGDQEMIMQIVDFLKKSSSSLNMNYIWQTICLLESALKRQDYKMIDIYFEILNTEYLRLEKYLEKKMTGEDDK